MAGDTDNNQLKGPAEETTVTVTVTATAMAKVMETATEPCYGGGGGNVGGGGGEREYGRNQPPWCGDFFVLCQFFFKVKCHAIFVR